MKNIKIGNKFETSAVSLGCMRMGNLNEKSVDAIIDTAIENGINFLIMRIFTVAEIQKKFLENI